jgi:hypothetical protein
MSSEFGFGFFLVVESKVFVATLLVGYCYTVEGAGAGCCLEPNVGQRFCATGVKTAGQRGKYSDMNIPELATAAGIGYPFAGSQGMIPVQFNAAIG